MFDSVDLTPEEERVIRDLISSGPSDRKQLLESIFGKIASQALNHGLTLSEHKE